jgi:hypothetical protein
MDYLFINTFMKFFLINKRRHRSVGLRLGFVLFCKKICMEARFTESCLYSLGKNHDQVNKLFGISLNILPFFDKNGIHAPHHKNSIRIGWRCVDGEKIEILSYVYFDKKRVQTIIGECSVDENVRFSLEIDKNDYLLKMVDMNGNSGFARLPFAKGRKSFFGYKLFPYFGGKIPAPHKMKIFLGKIKKLV